MAKTRSMMMAPEKENPKKTRGITRTDARPQKANDKPFLNPKEMNMDMKMSRSMKGKC